MEYIEPKPKEVKPHAKRNKIIIISSVCAALVAAISLTYYFVISKVFIEYENVGLFTYSYRYDVDGSGVRIDAIKEEATLPSKFRIPNQLGGRPVVEIAPEVFATNEDIKEVIFPDSLKIIGNNCFSYCENLEKFNVPKNLASIGTDAFSNTKWLADQEDGEVTIGDMLYVYKGKMDYPAYIVKNENSPYIHASGTVVNLGAYKNMSSGVFKDQASLVYAEIPEHFTTIYESTFDGCDALEEVVLHDKLTTINDLAFSYCSSLSKINIPESVTYIGSSAFSYSKLTGEIHLNKNLEYLGYGAFKGCNEITKVNIPYGFESISDSLFEDCSKLAEVDFSDEDLSVLSTISYIGENAFKGTALTSFDVPFNVNSVKKNAFAECSELKYITAYNNVLGTPEIVRVLDEEKGEYVWTASDVSYQGILKFESGMFNNSPLFEGLVLVDELGNELTPRDEVNVPVTLSSLGGTNNDSFFFSGTNVKTLRLAKDYSAITDLSYLEIVKGRNITTLPPSLCEGAEYLKVVDFGTNGSSDVTVINRSAFKDCVSLESIVIDNDVKTIETNVFQGCVSLKNVTLPTSCDAITTNCFYGCESLEEINVPENYKTIGQEAFAYCTKLVNVNLGANPSLTNIGMGAFSGCVKLASFVIPNTCDALAANIFFECESLTSVTISSNPILTSIKSLMFAHSGITSIVLPSNIKFIEVGAFVDSKLSSITLESPSVVSLYPGAFEGSNIEHIYVPSDLVESYKTNSEWSDYSSIIEAIN